MMRPVSISSNDCHIINLPFRMHLISVITLMLVFVIFMVRTMDMVVAHIEVDRLLSSAPVRCDGAVVLSRGDP